VGRGRKPLPPEIIQVIQQLSRVTTNNCIAGILNLNILTVRKYAKMGHKLSKENRET